MIDTSGDIEIYISKLTAYPERQSIDARATGSDHGFLTLVIVAYISPKMCAEVERHPTT